MKALVNNGKVVARNLTDAAALDPLTFLVTDSTGNFYIGTPVNPALVADTTTPPADAPLSCFSFVGGQIVFSASAYAELITAAITAKLAALGEYGIGRAHGGTTVNGFHYDTDTESKGDLDSAFNLAQTASSPASFDWWMSTGWQSIPKAQILADAPVVGVWYEANFSNLRAHWNAIMALTTLTAVSGYDYSTGWPAGT